MTDDDPGDAQPDDDTPALHAAPWVRTAHPFGDNPCQIDTVEFTIRHDDDPVAVIRDATRKLKLRMEAVIVGDQRPQHGGIAASRQTASARALDLTPDQIAVAFFRPITMHRLPMVSDHDKRFLFAEWRLVPKGSQA